MKKVEIHLSKTEKKELEDFVRKGTAKAREISRARVLLLSDSGKSPTEISHFIGGTLKTIQSIKERYLEGGLARALHDAPRPGQPTRFSGKNRAQITALACTVPPKGHSHWSLRMLADKAVELDYVGRISHTEVGKILKKK